jgi:Asp-tRNA(Asn)/Glu-tRNA(Gln) amidotransferase A subunit family amidase
MPRDCCKQWSADKLVASNDVQKYEFKNLINVYLARIPNAPVKSLAEIIASGKYHKPSLERLMVDSESYQDGMNEFDYKERLLRNQRTRQILASLMADNRVDALVYPLQKRLVVPISDNNQTDRNGILAAVTGFPAITVPAGFSTPSSDVPIGVPIGIDILGRPWSEGRLLQIGNHFEQVTDFRKPPASTPPLSLK